MKTLITVLAIALGTSVFAQKTTTEQVSNQTPTESLSTVTSDQTFPQTGMEIVGTVVYQKFCPIYILADVNNETVKLHPTNLDTKFQIDGQKIKFNYKVVTKVDMPSECNFKAAVEVSNVKGIKGSKI